MDLDFERRLNRLLVAALELPAERRRDHVLASAGDDESLATEALGLLAAQGSLAGFLERPAVVDLNYLDLEADAPGADATDGVDPDSWPERIGSFKLVERLGAGGMGEVFRARQEEPVEREVALKRIRAHLPPEARERFLVEQRALARLAHSNVARFHDAGTTAGGHPYFAMELVPGRPITRYCDEERLPVPARLRLFLDVCAGVEHAHQRQILHRDLKPSNVLVVEESGRAVPKVIDFGIAKSLAPAGSGVTLETGTGLLGTPSYMSPEALAPERVEGGLDTRADIYSLGVLLFELLTGRTPFTDGDPGLVALLGRVEAGTAETPSRQLRSFGEEESREVAESRGTTPPELLRTVGGDLDWIVARAMAPERERRYGSVGELAADVARHLADEPVTARPPRLLYRLGKLARRHRALAAASLVGLVGLLIGLIGLGYGLVRERQEATATHQALEESQALSQFLVGLFDASRPGSAPPDEISAQDLLDRGAEDLGTRFANQPAARGRFLRVIGDVDVQMGRYEEAAGLFDEAESLLRSALPTDDPDVATVLRSRGVLAFHRGQWQQADDLLRAGLRGLDPAEEPEDWALAVHNIGVALLSRGEVAAAKAELLRALEVRERYLPTDHPHLARSWSALGTVELQEGNFERAAMLFERALALRRKTLGPNHAYVALALKNLALADQRLERWDDAEAALTEAIGIQERVLPPGHPDLAQPLLSLGNLRASRAQPQRAEEPLRRAFEIRRAALGEDHPLTLQAMRPLSRNLLDLGRLDEAEPLLRRVFEVFQAAGEEDRLEYVRLDLGRLALERGDLSRAEPLLEHSLEVWESKFGPDHRNLSWPLLALSRIHQSRGELREAEAMARRALEIRRMSYPPDHPWVAEARERHAEVLAEQRRAATGR